MTIERENRLPARIRAPEKKSLARVSTPLFFLALSVAGWASEKGAGESSTPQGVTSAAIEAAIERGVEFLVSAQNRDGSWGSARRTKGLNIYAPVPGAHHAFRTGVTSLCVSALCELGFDGRLAEDTARPALTRAEEWLKAKLPSLRRATPDAIYNVWGHAYALSALAHMSRSSRGAGEQEELRKLMAGQVGYLSRYELVDGGWGYYDFDVGSQKPAGSPSSFTTSTVLIALHEAEQVGVTSPAKMLQRALASVRRQQKPDFSYLYGEYTKWQPMWVINRPGGSLGRSQACNLALRLWGDPRITDQVLQSWLQRLIDRNLWLDMGRKRPVPHESWFLVAAYFYYYGHYYASLCIDQLPPKRRLLYQKRLARILLERQEKDGSWWDFPFYDYHQPYGTAFAIMSLRRCLPSVEAVGQKRRF